VDGIDYDCGDEQSSVMLKSRSKSSDISGAVNELRSGSTSVPVTNSTFYHYFNNSSLGLDVHTVKKNSLWAQAVDVLLTFYLALILTNISSRPPLQRTADIFSFPA
jgi:hypothetical protein